MRYDIARISENGWHGQLRVISYNLDTETAVMYDSADLFLSRDTADGKESQRHKIREHRFVESEVNVSMRAPDSYVFCKSEVTDRLGVLGRFEFEPLEIDAEGRFVSFRITAGIDSGKRSRRYALSATKSGSGWMLDETVSDKYSFDRGTRLAGVLGLIDANIGVGLHGYYDLLVKRANDPNHENGDY